MRAFGKRITHSGKDSSKFEVFEQLRVEAEGATIDAARGGKAQSRSGGAIR